jgi:DNA-binding CsgD family transcriptional regulator
MALRWPLAGRTEELRLIDKLTRGRDGPVGVVLAGAAGVGKTRLAFEALAVAAQRGALTRWTVATASARVLPLGAFAATLPAVGSDSTRLMRQATEALLAGAGRGGVVLGVDDAHLLDELSALLVHQLALRRAAAIVVTLRSGEPTPDAVTALWKDGHLQRLELQPLSQADTTILLEAALGGLVDSADARRLWTITRGNALFLRQLVDGELEAGRLHQVAGVWRWSGQPELSAGLVELVQSRIGRVPEDHRVVVETLAFGEPLGVALLAELTDSAVVEQAEARGLIEVYPDGRRLQARLAHPLYGEVQRAQVGRLHARRLRGRIARALAETGARRGEDTLRRAVLTLDAELAPDPELLGAAARRAIELLDLGLGERLARAAIAAGGGFEPRLILGYVLAWSGRGTEADTELTTLAMLATTDTERARATVPRVGNLFWTLARPAEAQSVLAATRSTITDEGARHELTAIHSVFDAFQGRPTQAIDAATEVLRAPPSSAQAVAFAGWGLITARGGLGRLDELDDTRQRIEALTDSVNTAPIRRAAYNSWIRAQRLAGLLDVAEHAAQRYRELAQDTPGHSGWIAAALCGEVALARGQVQSAVRWLRQASAGLRNVDSSGWSLTCTLPLTQALAMTGDAPAARQIMATWPAGHRLRFPFKQPDVLLAHAWVAAADNTLSQAVTLARQAADLAAAQGQPAVEVLALHTAVCFGDRAVATRLAELATHVEGPRAPTAAAHATALATHDGAALHAASAQLEQMGALLLAADAAAQAAAVYTSQGQRGSALTAAARAHRLADACEHAHTPALAAAAAPLPLTKREREIITLASQGLSNRDIAERLGVSVRTVEGHLYRACAKLGTSDRSTFAALLHGD